MPKTPLNQPEPSVESPIESFGSTPYGYWVLSSLSETRQESFKAALKQNNAVSQQHLERATKSTRLATEKDIGEQEWKSDYERLQIIINATLSLSEQTPTEIASAADGTDNTTHGGLAALPENQG